jgi:hypothetical protein
MRSKGEETTIAAIYASKAPIKEALTRGEDRHAADQQRPDLGCGERLDRRRRACALRLRRLGNGIRVETHASRTEAEGVGVAASKATRWT